MRSTSDQSFLSLAFYVVLTIGTQLQLDEHVCR